MGRVRFRKGEQRLFIKKILLETSCPSLNTLNQFGFEIPYSTWRNYFTEQRNLPENLFKELCELIKIDPSFFEVEYLNDNYGQILGGKRNKKD